MTPVLFRDRTTAAHFLRYTALAAIAAGGLLGGLCPALAGEIYRCKLDGHTILTDTPCEEQAENGERNERGAKLPEAKLPRAAARAGARQILLQRQGAHRFHGNWYGPLQLQLSIGGRPVDGGFAVVQAAFEVDENGRFSGSAPAAGCQFRGSAIWDGALGVYIIDVTASGCRSEGFNKRYSGQMLMFDADTNAILNLSARDYLGMGQPARLALTDARATLHR